MFAALVVTGAIPIACSDAAVQSGDSPTLDIALADVDAILQGHPTKRTLDAAARLSAAMTSTELDYLVRVDWSGAPADELLLDSVIYKALSTLAEEPALLPTSTGIETVGHAATHAAVHPLDFLQPSSGCSASEAVAQALKAVATRVAPAPGEALTAVVICAVPGLNTVVCGAALATVVVSAIWNAATNGRTAGTRLGALIDAAYDCACNAKGGQLSMQSLHILGGRSCTLPGRDAGTDAPGAAAYSVGGTVTGLAGAGLALQNNAGDEISIGANGSFAFPTRLTRGSSYEVTVANQPRKYLSQTCTVNDGTGRVAAADVTDVAVVCVTNEFTVGGTVTGLAGSGLVLQNNGAGDLSVYADGGFTFGPSQADGSDFKVTVKTDPFNPGQTCLVTGGIGKIAGGNVTSVAVSCSTKKYSVGGAVSGLQGAGMVIRNNGGDDLAINANGEFAFPTPIEDLAPYDVTVETQPSLPSQTCTVTNRAGNVAQAPVTNISIACN